MITCLPGLTPHLREGGKGDHGGSKGKGQHDHSKKEWGDRIVHGLVRDDTGSPSPRSSSSSSSRPPRGSTAGSRPSRQVRRLYNFCYALASNHGSYG